MIVVTVCLSGAQIGVWHFLSPLTMPGWHGEISPSQFYSQPGSPEIPPSHFYSQPSSPNHDTCASYSPQVSPSSYGSQASPTSHTSQAPPSFYGSQAPPSSHSSQAPPADDVPLAIPTSQKSAHKSHVEFTYSDINKLLSTILHVDPFMCKCSQMKEKWQTVLHMVQKNGGCIGHDWETIHNKVKALLKTVAVRFFFFFHNEL